ncbi:hypothetical protein F5Y05DRAFT_380666 [Hypoxylon sp. FL0543]|nr:hypothetical protein F5Y05DRAFT_380666 [Hypoxylon sp. FL0543]
MSTKRSREMDSAETETERKRLCRKSKCNKIISPEVGSVYDILHDYATVSLYVPPLCWTDLHTQVLGCRFVPQPPQNTPTPPLLPSSPPQVPSQPQSPGMVSQAVVSETVVAISRSLDAIMDPITTRSTRSRRIRSLLSMLFPGQLAEMTPELTIRCGVDCYVGGARCHGLWKKRAAPQSFNSVTTLSSSSLGGPSVHPPIAPESYSSKPVLAYLDRRQLNYVRRGCFRIPPYPNGSTNVPVHRLQAIRSRKLIPKNLDEDHYILAIMIGMAQEHAYESVFFGSGFAPKDVQVRVLSVSDEDHSLIVYTTIIPAAFLAMFNELDKAPRGDASITIQYQRVPVWPVLGLKERLGQALGQDLVGEIDPGYIETFWHGPSSSSQCGSNIMGQGLEAAISQLSRGHEPLPTVPQVAPSPRRKREILSEVLNVSFSEDRESPGYPSELLAKRQCLEEGNNDELATSSPPNAS